MVAVVAAAVVDDETHCHCCLDSKQHQQHQQDLHYCYSVVVVEDTECDAAAVDCAVVDCNSFAAVGSDWKQRKTNLKKLNLKNFYYYYYYCCCCWDMRKKKQAFAVVVAVVVAVAAVDIAAGLVAFVVGLESCYCWKPLQEDVAAAAGVVVVAGSVVADDDYVAVDLVSIEVEVECVERRLEDRWHLLRRATFV